MSGVGVGAGGRLVVLDRSGREARSFPLRGATLATLGSDHACDIRVMLPAVAKHHATIAVHSAQTVIRNVEGSATLVNGVPVSVAALRHGDVITLADRHLRWEYDDPTGRRQPRGASPSVRVLAAAAAAAGAAGGSTRGRRRGSDTAATAATVLHRDRALQLALEMNHRASMPGSSGGKQVAIVQPQRRDTSLQIDVEQSRSSPQPKRRSHAAAIGTDGDSSLGAAASGTVPAHTTQATLWIESRKTSPRRAKSLQTTSVGSATATATSRRSTGSGRGRRARGRKSTPLRMAVLKRAHRPSLVKIQAPLTIDYTKQAAIMLMTGHTKSKLSKSPTYVVKKPSPVRKTPRNSRRTLGVTPRRTPRGSGLRTSGSLSQHTSVGSAQHTLESPAQHTLEINAGSAPGTPGVTGNRAMRSSGNQSVSIVEIPDSESNPSNMPSVATHSSKSPRQTPALPSASPKKSALKDTTKKTSRKIESIKFDLTNLENHNKSDVVLLSDSTKHSDSNISEDDITLHYSDSSVSTLSPSSPSSGHSIHSRSSRVLEKLDISRQSVVDLPPSRTLTPNSRTSRKSTRGSLIVQKALDESSLMNYTQSEQSRVASAFRTRTISPRKNMESYSIVDLVSLESNDSSVYSSADSTNTGDYGTPQTSVGRRTRSTIDPTLLGSSTPYLGHKRQTRSKSNITMNISTRSSISMRRSKSLTTPENKYVSVNSTRVSRRSRSRSRINDSDLLLLDDTEIEDSSPKTSKRTRSTKCNVSDMTAQTTNIENEGSSTPENRQSPVEIGTPVLSIQSLLDSSRSSLTSHTSSKRGRRAFNSKRKTIGVLSERRPRAVVGLRANSSFGCNAKKTVLRLSRGSSETSVKTDEGAPQPDNEETVTPKSAVKLVPEAVKNKHSTAKKPVSKRSLIDDLNESDIVKQLFNSPVKRKLSQSMTEFSRKQSFDEEDVVRVRRPTRNTFSVGDDSLSDNDAIFTPERFVSPIQTPNDTLDMSGIKRLFKKNTPNNDPCNVRGVRSLLRTPRTRKSGRNDLTNISNVKAIFAKSPRNRLSDVRVKEVFAASPANDLRRVTGVKALFREKESPKNDLRNVRGVKRLFAKKSPRNDLRNVSGVKKTFDRNTPKNDLTDVRGVRKMFEHQRRRREETADMSGIEELFRESTPSVHDSEALFDQLVGKPVIKAVYSKTLSTKKPTKKPRLATSLHTSMDVITNNVEEWLEEELQKRLHRGDTSSATSKVTKELQRLATETVQGEEPILPSRTRNTSTKKSASDRYSEHSLPIKKRSLVQVSLDSSKNKLPIKKRAVVHSTPVKGRINITMNASELGRVSPIAVFDHTKDHVRSTRQMTTVEEKPRRRVAEKPAAVEDRTPPRRVTRNRKVVELTERNAKSRRNSLVITKKTPVMSPKPDLKAKSDSANLKKTTRSSRAKKDKTIETPKKTRTRAQKATVVVTKLSPHLKPRRAKRTEPLAEPETKRVQRETPKRSQKGRKTKVDFESEAEERPVPKRTRKTTTQTESSTAALEEAPKRSRRGKANLTNTKTPVEKITQNKKVIEMEVEPSIKPKRGRPKITTNGDAIEPVVKKQGQGAVRAARAPRPTRAHVTVVLDTSTNTRTRGKRKATVPEEIPKKVSKSEASKRKVANKDDSDANNTRRGRRQKVELTESPAKVSRSRSTRGNMAATTTRTRTMAAAAAADAEAEAEPEPKDNLIEVGRRRRVTSAKESSKKGSRVVSVSPVRRTRGARAALVAKESVAPPPASVAAARSRRR